MPRIWKCTGIVLTLVIILIVIISLLCTEANETPNIQQPHIIVIVADDLGWNDVGFHGADQVPTPNIDALAYNGVILQRHYVLPTCTPSRTAFLTGRYPIATGMQGYPLKAGEKRAIPLENALLPEYLQELGYATHLVGKWHVGYYSDNRTPTRRGFDTFYGYYNGYVQYFNHTIDQDGHRGYDLHYDNQGKLSVEYNYEYLTDLITEKAENVIKTHDNSKPLYLHIAHLAAHSSDAEDTMEVRDAKEVNETLGYIGDVNRRKLAGVVTALDESVGRVVTALKQSDMLKNSIIVFMTDNGAQTEGFLENFGSNYPLRGLKFSFFEGAVRGVACVYSPLINNVSRISKQLFHVTDWLPTFYSAAGGDLKNLQNIDGQDQWSVLKFAKETKRQWLLVNIDEVEGTSGAIIGRHKLIKGAKIEYGGYYGDTGMNEAYPKYNITQILDSPAGSAISSISKYPLKSTKVVKLRNDAKVVCDKPMGFPACLDKCLFDIYEDPCETTDLSATYPNIVQELDNFIEGYRTVLVNQTNQNLDPAGIPENFNGTWMPWIRDSSVIEHLH